MFVGDLGKRERKMERGKEREGGGQIKREQDREM